MKTGTFNPSDLMALEDKQPPVILDASMKTPRVRLRSGGPPMTVIEVKGNVLVCSWSAGHSAEFPIEALTPVPEDRPN